MIIIDGVVYDHFIDVNRVAELKATELSGIMLDRRYYNDVIGTYYRFDCKIALGADEKDVYDELFEQLTDPYGEHTFVLPYGQGQIQVVGRLSGIQDVYRKTPEGRVWKGLKFTITANHPSKELSYGQVLHRGLTPLPDYASGELDNQDFIRAAYEVILGREPDEGGMTAWLAAMDSGRTPSYVLRKIASSEEATAEEVQVRKQLIRICYYEMLDRMPSASEVRTWDEVDLSIDGIIGKIQRSEEYAESGTSVPVATVRRQCVKMAYWAMLQRKATEDEAAEWEASDQSVDRIIEKIAGSQEYKEKHGGAVSPLTAPRLALIHRAYVVLLGRDATGAEASQWESTGITVDRVVEKLIASSEYEESGTGASAHDARVALIAEAYLAILDRAASESEVDSWDKSGITLDRIMEKLMRSEEYRRKQD